MIPKIIHYCWFGGNKKTKLMKKCIRSWKKQCPDYKIIEWNEKNFDIENSCLYVKQAYQEKKWAFVSDYVRLKVIYLYGGIYLDTDVELLKNLDSFLKHPAFFAYQDDKYINTGLGFGAEKGNKFVECMLNDYLKCFFYDERGNFDLKPCTVRNTKSVERYLQLIQNTKQVNFLENVVLYPKEYFSPIDCKTKIMEKTEKTVSIHWFTASWMDSDYLITNEYHNFYNNVSKILGKRTTYIYVTCFYWLFRNKKFKYLKNKWKINSKN